MKRLNISGRSNLSQIKTDSSLYRGGRKGRRAGRARGRDLFLFYVRMEVNRGRRRRARRDVRASGKGIGSPQPLYKLFLLSPWVLFRVLIYRRH